MSPPSSNSDDEASDEAVAEAVETFEEQQPVLGSDLRETIRRIGNGHASSEDEVDDVLRE